MSEIPKITLIRGEPTGKDREALDAAMEVVADANLPLLGRKKVLAVYSICLVEVAEGRARICTAGQALSPQLLEFLREIYQETEFTQAGETTHHPLPKTN